jgi:hypothetical protein
MTITEYIARLEQFRAEHGDLEVVLEQDLLAESVGAVAYDDSYPTVERASRGKIVFRHSPEYSEDLPKVVWV